MSGSVRMTIPMLSETLQRYFPFQHKDLVLFLAKPDFEESIRRNKLGNGKHCIKIKCDGKVVGRSVEFDSKSERDVVRDRLVDLVYIHIHKDVQRTLGF